MKLNITYDGQTISVTDGKSLTLKCKDLKARGNITVSAVADDAVSQITNLKGYAVTVPSGWTQQNLPSSETTFNITGIVSYDPTAAGGMISDVTFDSFTMYEHDGDYAIDFRLGTNYGATFKIKGFILQIQGGTDVTNSSLIQWLYDNNATFKKLINFTVGNNDYVAELGMTWYDWIQSAYNTDNFIIGSRYVETEDGKILYADGSPVSPSNKIIDGETYSTNHAGGSN